MSTKTAAVPVPGASRDPDLLVRKAPGVGTRPTILVVEDDPASRVLMTRVLEGAGYSVMTAADGESALHIVSVERPDLVVLDIGLPGVDGLEVCARLRAEPRNATLPILMLTARVQLDDIVGGLGVGADDYLAKPFRQPELLARIRAALRLRAALVRMETAHAVVAALANAVEAKDPLTEHHCQRLAFLATRLTDRLGLDHAEAEIIAYGALLHDVGKIGIPEAILTKPGPLSEPEWELMRRHPEIGERICRPLGAGARFLPVIRHHHERWDGRGYPDGLAGDAIPLGARIVAIADAFDAMTHDRHYRTARSVADALTEIHAGGGGQFDPELAPIFVDVIEGGELPAPATTRSATFPVPLGEQ
ncbi:MAG TPA: HD domain-containing phosphohydrolase [Candidatus Limnocylindria bacterium]|nr:HD domain-containing phosphohydrolase [Candidatus Limnocylindria bacterium]